jgi:hypothetical protein
MICTNNAVEALHRSLRKIIKTRGSFPDDDAAFKSCFISPSGMPECAGGEQQGRPVCHSVRSAFSAISAIIHGGEKWHGNHRKGWQSTVKLRATSMAGQQAVLDRARCPAYSASKHPTVGSG